MAEASAKKEVQGGPVKPKELAWRTRLLPVLFAGLAWPILLLLALSAPFNHDEDQYVAAALLAGSRQIYRDFLYLQSPVQPILMTPLIGLIDGWTFVLLRLATASLAALLLVEVYLCARCVRSSARGALVATAMLASCQTFLFSATVVRNDMLPAVLEAGAMLAALRALQDKSKSLVCWFIAGATLGLATSTKVSYALPAAGCGLFLLVRRSQRANLPRSAGDLVAFAAGSALGLLPCLIAWHDAPEAFVFAVVQFALEAPAYWYKLNGYGWRLGLAGKVADSVAIMMLGPVLIAMAVVARDRIQRRRAGEQNPETLTWLETLAVAGLVAALLPTPTWRQYFLPLLPPLFVRMAAIEFPRDRGMPWKVAFALTMAAGSFAPALHLLQAGRSGHWPALVSSREAQWIAGELSRAGRGGSIATLSPHLVVESDASLDPAFSTGVFVYRSGDMINAQDQRRLHIVSPLTLNAHLETTRPLGIITGYESHSNLDRIGLDSAFEKYARSNGYEVEKSPFGRARLFVKAVRARPTGAADPRVPKTRLIASNP